MRRLLVVLALIVSPSLFATTFRFEPPSPDNATPVSVTISGIWNSGCVPTSPSVTFEQLESRVVIVFSVPSGACSGALTPWSSTVPLGTLPAGIYTVAAFVHGPGDTRTNLGDATLVVRDVTTFTITPSIAPLAGGTTVRITSPEAFDVEPIHVYFGLTEVQSIRRIAANVIEVTAPPETTAGPVDIRVESVMGGVHIAHSAFTYYDFANAANDPFTFTWVLFPVDYAGAGAFGAQWTTENVLDRGDGAVTNLPVTGSAAGRVEYVLRAGTPAANSRIRDLSRQAQTAGTEIPVVREDDFRNEVRLLNVPGGVNSRVQLRVWTSGQMELPISVNVFGPATPLSLIPQPAGSLRYATRDLTPLLQGVDHLDLRIAPQEQSGVRVWAMVSITNNETQQVTIVSPQL